MRTSNAVLYLYSNKHLAGSALALLGLLLMFTGVIGVGWPLITLALYAAGALAVPGEPRGALPTPAPVHTADVLARLQELEDRTRGRLPREAETRLHGVISAIREALPRLRNLEKLGDRGAYLVRETALSYLPTAVEAYLTLPPAYARLHRRPDGKTPAESLSVQLALLEGVMNQVVEDLAGDDATALETHGRFLQERFQTPALHVLKNP
ncbi:hypothetical protein [Deinococcus hopiensis]|uniref:5-bromo-4-chloroindolyl phosphate hydrolysis protein n=1 Tax=Deinococcus hopiensis KR-140 TaxID=695939 RepID=A0A1W1USW0_9DEIO|nr:hypothetical protein [Deinococcus hopiensis]SMB84187.1 hypothetical protein SAMN00790413_05025 [Deinococcus hopiensis KR-140]